MTSRNGELLISSTVGIPRLSELSFLRKCTCAPRQIIRHAVTTWDMKVLMSTSDAAAAELGKEAAHKIAESTGDFAHSPST